MKTTRLLITIAVSIISLSACGPSAEYIVGNATTPVDSPSPAATTPPVTSIAPTQSSAPTSEPQSSTTTSAPLTFSSIRMFDARQGWALEANRRGVLHTSDGGLHWQRVKPTKLSENTNASAFFLNPTTAWLATTTSIGDSLRGDTVIWRTSDAGQTWLTSTLSLQANGMQPTGGTFSFLDPQHGWFMAGLGVALGSEPIAILRTIDGGATWQQVELTLPNQPAPNEIPFGGDKTGMTFNDQMTGWVTVTMPAPGVPTIYKTADGGATWHLQQLPLPQGEATTNGGTGFYVFPPTFFTSQTGMLRTRLYQFQAPDTLYVTEDGGQTWTARPAWAMIEDAAFVNINNGWLVGQPNDLPSDRAHLYRTSDGGQTWIALATDRNFHGLTITFADVQHGWAWSTSQPGLLYTSDGGQTWNAADAASGAQSDGTQSTKHLRFLMRSFVTKKAQCI